MNGEDEAKKKLAEQLGGTRRRDKLSEEKEPRAVEEAISRKDGDERYLLNERGSVRKIHLEEHIRRMLENFPAELVHVADEDGNFDSEFLEGALVELIGAFADLAGEGRTTETVKANADAIAAIDISPPVGTTYIQFYGKDAPGDLWSGTWTDISSEFAGYFFRAVGGNAAAFGTPQANQNKEHLHGIYCYYGGTTAGLHNYGASSYNTYQGTYNTLNEGGNEARPDNYAIKIWERTA